MIAGRSRRNISKGYSSYGKKSLPAAHREIFFGVIIHMVKNYCWRQPAINFRVLSSYGKKIIIGGGWQEIFWGNFSLLLVTANEKCLRIILHMEKNHCRHPLANIFRVLSLYGKKNSPAAAGEKFLGVNFQLVKIIVCSSQRKFFNYYS